MMPMVNSQRLRQVNLKKTNNKIANAKTCSPRYNENAKKPSPAIRTKKRTTRNGKYADAIKADVTKAIPPSTRHSMVTQY